MQNLTLTGWSPFRCMCLWYKNNQNIVCKYSFFFFVTLNENICFYAPTPLPSQVPKYRVPKTKVIYCRALLYTQTLWHRATRASFSFMYIQNIFKQLRYTHKKKTLLTFADDLTRGKVVLSLAGPPGVLTNYLFSFSPAPPPPPLTHAHAHTGSDLQKHTQTYTRHDE